MRKIVVLALSVIVIVSIVLLVIDKNQDKYEAKKFPLNSEQKNIILSAKEQGRELSKKEMDSFTIGQGKFLLDQYLKNNNLNYAVGSKQYIHFLADISENKNMRNKPEFNIIEPYSNIYLAELQKKDPLLFRFHLKKSILDQTIKEVRKENIK
ncbi:hypothetical protein [Priestia koreensis]|uniref:hypothetical protein n=1 Tax=Priestia koreensis TaxID=284581 RepID=UPI00204217FD|nr:hypothetical protein [Priestia koreensis]MCM3005734.1 hypothetical protein [Priestia koreensis]